MLRSLVRRSAGSRRSLLPSLSLALLGGALAIVLLVPADADAKKKKKGKTDEPKIGWHREEGWAGDCWYPPNFSEMPAGTKRVAWNESREAILSQWRGERGDGVSLDSRHVENIETIILSKPERTETVAVENLEQCEAMMKGKGSNAQWEQWLVAVAGRLTEGECPYPPMDYQYHNYLSVNSDWHLPVNVCKGDRLIIHGTENDYYQLEKGGPWMNVAGNPSLPLGGNLPCNIEGCVRGQLVMRFTSDTHVQQVIPIGITTEFLVPEHGRIELMINDDSLDDNKFKVETGLEHHTGIEIRPSGG